jgi:hypothetical protein
MDKQFLQQSLCIFLLRMLGNNEPATIRKHSSINLMKNIFIYCFDKWWRPLLFFILIAGLLILNCELNIRFIKKPLLYLSNVSVIVIFISICYQLYKRQFWKGIYTFLVLLSAGIISMMTSMVDGDHWADDLIIPSDIQIENPINVYSGSDSILTGKKAQTDLILYNSGQPGMYQYIFRTAKIESGTIYLKAFEITQDEELSTEYLEENTLTRVNNPSDSIVHYSSPNIFTIYEGDWGKYYAARFEVWLRPSSGENERKIFNKNFKIEGWMH